MQNLPAFYTDGGAMSAAIANCGFIALNQVKPVADAPNTTH
jgi:hypothetical protein